MTTLPVLDQKESGLCILRELLRHNGMNIHLLDLLNNKTMDDLTVHAHVDSLSSMSCAGTDLDLSVFVAY